jgi:hypothetical protein
MQGNLWGLTSATQMLIMSLGSILSPLQLARLIVASYPHLSMAGAGEVLHGRACSFLVSGCCWPLFHFVYFSAYTLAAWQTC